MMGTNQDAADFAARLPMHRRRQASVATILDALFGPFAKSDPELWERRAYLMLIGTVYERLATPEDCLSDEALVKLSKTLAEHRRIGLAQAKKSRADKEESDDCVSREPQSAPTGEADKARMAQRFVRSIQEIYGANLSGTAKTLSAVDHEMDAAVPATA